MNVQIQAHFDRLEAALNTLVDSITSYNPSPAAAESLVAANDELDEGLQQLVQHQRNHKRIVALQAESAALDERIKFTLQTLADTRQELLQSTPVTVPNPESARVDYSELLNYAQRIAKFTVPPTYRPPMPPPIEIMDKPGTALGGQPTTNTAEDQPMTTNESSHLQVNEGKAFATLSDATKAWLDPDSEALPFTPWPSEIVIRRGALSQIQTVRERGLDPAKVNAAGELPGAVEDTRQPEMEVDESAANKAKATERRMSSNITAAARSEAREPVRHNVFEGLDLYDPDDLG